MTVKELMEILATLPPDVIVTRADVDYGEVAVENAVQLDEGENYYLFKVEGNRIMLS